MKNGPSEVMVHVPEGRTGVLATYADGCLQALWATLLSLLKSESE